MRGEGKFVMEEEKDEVDSGDDENGDDGHDDQASTLRFLVCTRV